AEIARGNGGTREPVLLVGARAGCAGVTHPLRPQLRGDRNIAGDGGRLAVGTGLIDPAILDDQRESQTPLEILPPLRKKFARRLVAVGSAAERIGAFPSAFMSLRVEPAVELNGAQANVHVPELVAHANERAGISKLVREAVVVGRAMIGPIPQVFQAEI